MLMVLCAYLRDGLGICVQVGLQVDGHVSVVISNFSRDNWLSTGRDSDVQENVTTWSSR